MLRLSQIFFHGSYGLAEGNGNLTNADTAALTIGLIRSGWYVFNTTYLRIIGEGMIRTRTHTRYNAANVYLSEKTLSPDSDYNPAYGMSVRCDTPSLIISPEAMGWPWDVV